MKICPICGVQNPDEAAFCQECGADLKDVLAEEAKKSQKGAEETKPSQIDELNNLSNDERLENPGKTIETKKVSESNENKNGLSVASLVLGIVSLICSWIPILNNIFFITAILGAVFGILVLAKRNNAQKTMAIISIVLNVLALFCVLGTQKIYSSAIDEAMNSAGLSQSQSGDSNNSSNSNKENTPTSSRYLDMSMGTKIELNSGLVISVDSIKNNLKNYDGKTMSCVTLTLENDSDETLKISPYEWVAEDTNGQQKNSQYYSKRENVLESSNLRPGGKISANLYFEGNPIKILYLEASYSSKAIASWIVEY